MSADRAGTTGARVAPGELDPEVLADYADFYESLGWAAFWTSQDGNGLRRELYGAMRAAWEHGLPDRSAAASRLEDAWVSLAAGGQLGDMGELPEEYGTQLRRQRSKVERAFMDAMISYAGALRSGIVDPSSIAGIYLEPEPLDRSAVLRDLAAGRSVAGILRDQVPQGRAYQALMRAYVELRALAAKGDWRFEAVAADPLRRGDVGVDVAFVRARLHELGDLVWSDESADVFDAVLEAGVRRFQARHGITADGIVGPRTVAEMNATALARMGQVAVALERSRWRSRDDAGLRIEVNGAEFAMRLIEGDRVLFSTQGIVGSAKHQTPEFDDMMDHMVVNPSWYVPASIAREEIMPEVDRDPDYLARNNMVRRDDGSIVQRPGPGNALGNVKFMFPNRHAIYLHDTPQKGIFARDVRAYSRGCVRLGDPYGFAEVLLSFQEADPAGRFAAALDSGKETRINLERPIPIHLTYQTAWVDRAGILQFRSDVYGRDRAILEKLVALGLGRPGR